MDDLYHIALKEHRLGNLDLAEKIYHDCLKNNLNKGEVLHLLGILLSQKEDFLNALHFVEQALANSKGSSDLYNTMGNILRNLKRYDEAIIHYQKALEIQYDNAAAHNNLGNVFYHIDRFDEAKKHYLEALGFRPNYLDPCYNLSLVLIKENSYQEARECLERVLELNPEHENANNNLAYLCQLQGDFDAAITGYQKVLDISRENIFACHNLGVILTNKGRYQDAIWYFKRVLSLDSSHVEALYNLGSIFLLQKDPAGALPYLLRLVEISRDFDVCYNLAVTYLDLNMLDEAINYFHNSLKINKNNLPSYVNLGAIYLHLKDFAKALQFYQKASELDPDNDEISYIISAITQNDSIDKAPVGYVQRLFDQYAPYFDRHLKFLEHNSPQIIFEMVKSCVGDKVGLDVLDLGCGTGLGGEKFKNISNRLIGIDISRQMIEVAKSKNIYTEIKLGSIEELLPGFYGFDIIIALDSFVYFGELDSIFKKSWAVLNTGGLFAFTVEEEIENHSYSLQRSARFSHSCKYIEKIAKGNNFFIIQMDRIKLRKHYGEFIYGYSYLLKK